jgi:hypothetical protein
LRAFSLRVLCDLCDLKLLTAEIAKKTRKVRSAKRSRDCETATNYFLRFHPSGAVHPVRKTSATS